MPRKEHLYTQLELELIALYVAKALNAEDDSELSGLLGAMDADSFKNLRDIRSAR